MALVLTKRIPNGAPLTASQHDANLTAIEGAYNSQQADLALRALSSQFEGLVGTKQTIDWVNVINKPAAGKSYAFRAANGSTQSIAVTTSGSAHLDIGTTINDPDSTFVAGAGNFVAQVNGFYQFNWSVGASLSSGTPTGISAQVSLRLNTSGQDLDSDDNTSGTGQRSYKGAIMLLCSAGDVVDLYFEVSQTGSATWDLQGATISGFLVRAT